MIEKKGGQNTVFGWESRSAVFSSCMNFRYELDIRLPITMLWDRGSKICWIGMNPSTADEMQDDPTLRRVKQFSQDDGHGRVVMLNAYALRSTDPEGLRWVVDPRGGPACDQHIALHCLNASKIVLAWGTGHVTAERRLELLSLLSPMADKVYALGLNKDGSPKHPLYVSGTTKLVRYEWEVDRVEERPGEAGDGGDGRIEDGPEGNGPDAERTERPIGGLFASGGAGGANP